MCFSKLIFPFTLLLSFTLAGCEWDGYAGSNFDYNYETTAEEDMTDITGKAEGSTDDGQAVQAAAPEDNGDNTESTDYVYEAKQVVARWFEYYNSSNISGCMGLSTTDYMKTDEVDRLFSLSYLGKCEIGFYGYPVAEEEDGKITVLLNFQATPEDGSIEAFLCRATVIFKNGEGRVDSYEEVSTHIVEQRVADKKARELFTIAKKYIDLVKRISYYDEEVDVDISDLSEEEYAYFSERMLPGDGMHHGTDGDDLIYYVLGNFATSSDEIIDIAVRDSDILYVTYEKDGVYSKYPSQIDQN